MFNDRSDILFEKITVLTPSPEGGTTVLEDAFVAVSGGRITAVTTSREEAIAALPSPWISYSGRHRLLMPSFANAHCHLAMTMMRNTADDMLLQDWLFNNIFPREAKLRPQDVATGMELSLMELIRGGCSCVADMYFYPETVAETAARAGVRIDLCQDAKVSGPDGKTVPAPDQAAAFVKRWHQAENGRIRVSLLVHSIYLYEEWIYREMSDIAKDLGVGIQVHVSETAKEVEDCVAKYGCRPPEKLAREGIFDVPTLAAHCVWLNDEDRSVLSSHGVHAVHNPVSNLKLGSGVADVPAMLKSGINVALGTDGAASNNRLDMFGEMRTAALLAKGVACDPTRLPAADVLRMATINGFGAMGHVDAGIIAPGMLADLQVLRLDDENLWPPADPVAMVVYSAGRENVESVLCDGRFLLYKGELTTLDEDRIRHDALDSAQHLVLE